MYDPFFIKCLNLLTEIGDISGTSSIITFPHSTFITTILFGFLKLIFVGSIFFTKRHLFFIIKTKLKEKITNKIKKNNFNDIWLLMSSDYFRRHSDDEIAWHIELISNNYPNNVVSIRESSVKGCSELTIYQNSRKNIFSIAANIIGNLNINIVDARIITLKNNQALDTYLLLDKEGKSIRDKYTLDYLKNKISDALSESDYKIKKIAKKQTENIASFNNFINIDITKKINILMLEISTLDHPGLLSKICESMDSCDLMVKDAKISTLGEEANDIFRVVPVNKNDYLDIDTDAIKDNLKQKISELYN